MERLRHHKFEKLSSGNAVNVEEFFEKIIKPQFIHKEKIQELHKTLMNYVKLDDATFFLRLYGSFPKDSYHLLRRGFLTEYPDKTMMAFCDNTFSMIFAGLKIGGFSISEEQLADYLKQKQLICSFGLTSKEKELSYYSPQKAIRVALNSKGWYQAHIKPTGYGFGELSKKNLQEFFPNPDRNEWDINKIRKTSENLPLEHKQLLVAHFVRLVHPLNSFLVPKKNHVIYSGKRIGEEVELIKYVRNYLRNQFPSEYEEFENITLSHSFPDSISSLNNISWYEEPVDNKSNKNVVKGKKQLKTVSDNNSIIKEEVEELDNKLEKWLKSIGKEVFIEILYPALQENRAVTKEEIAKTYQKFSTYTSNSQNSRLSTGRSIFDKGLECEALQIIIDSSRLDSNVSVKARKYLDGLNHGN